MSVKDTTHVWGGARRRRLVSLCAAVSGDREVAEDLAQETLLEAWRNAHKLTDPAGADRWLAAIARNVCRRWARREGRDAERAATVRAATTEPELEDEASRAEIGLLLERALAELPAETRVALVARYVDDLPHAEIAARLGVSEDAVAMRLSRGKAVLRRLLAADVAGAREDGWQETRLWCTQCGRARIRMRHDSDLLAFRCPACHPDPSLTDSEFRLDNPLFARIVGDLKRPATLRGRLLDWSGEYYAGGIASGEVDCTRCGAGVRLEPGMRVDAREGAARVGLRARCDSCGEQIWLSSAGIAVALPEVRRFLRDHPRTTALPRRDLDFGGTGAFVVSYRDLFGSAQADVVLERGTLRLLDVRAA